MTALQEFGSRVRVERERRRLTQKELGELADLDRTYIGGVERGERNVCLLTLLRIARALGMSAADLLEGDGDNV